VDFLAGTTRLGTVTNPLLNLGLIVTNLAAGTYVLTAIATDNAGGSAASASVSIKLVTPVAVTLRAPERMSANRFQFDYPANVGLAYIVQRSGDLAHWTSIATNTAGSNPVVFQDTNAVMSTGYYRVLLQPN
jgi:hypothetical protein